MDTGLTRRATVLATAASTGSGNTPEVDGVVTAPMLRRVALVALVVVFAATGCLSSDVSVVFDEDRSGAVDIEFEVPNDLRQLLEDAGFDDLVADALAGVEGARVDSVRRIGKRTYSVHVPFDDYGALTGNLLDGAVVAGQSVSLFSQFELTELSDGQGWRLTATTRPLDEVMEFSRDATGLALAAAFNLVTQEGQGTGLHLSIRLPGRVVSTNSDSVVDDVAGWDLRGGDVAHRLEMTTESVPLVSPLQWVLIIGGGVLVVGALLMFFGARGPARKWGSAGQRRRHPGTAPPTRWQDVPQTGAGPQAGARSATKRRRGSR